MAIEIEKVVGKKPIITLILQKIRRILKFVSNQLRFLMVVHLESRMLIFVGYVNKRIAIINFLIN